jgi:hypothetical protein
MPKPTERAVKRKPMAVIMLTANRSDIAEDGTVTMTDQGYDFEWFETEKNREKFFDQVNDWQQQDAKDHDDFAYLIAVVTDTSDMTLGRIEVAPHNPKMTKWKNAVKKNPSLLIAPVAAKTTEKKAEVKAPRKAAAKKAAASTEVKKGAAGDGAPKPRAVRAKPTAKKASGGAKGVATPTAKAADLRKKLAAKKGTTQAEAEVAALDEALKKS